MGYGPWAENCEEPSASKTQGIDDDHCRTFLVVGLGRNHRLPPFICCSLPRNGEAIVNIVKETNLLSNRIVRLERVD